MAWSLRWNWPKGAQVAVVTAVFQRLAEAHINVKYSYLATRNRLVIAAERPEDVLAALKTD